MLPPSADFLCLLRSVKGALRRGENGDENRVKNVTIFRTKTLLKISALKVVKIISNLF